MAESYLDKVVFEEIGRMFNLPINEIDVDCDLGRDLGFDSMSLVELVCTLEEFLEIEINLDALSNIETLADLITTLEQNYYSDSL